MTCYTHRNTKVSIIACLCKFNWQKHDATPISQVILHGPGRQQSEKPLEHLRTHWYQIQYFKIKSQNARWNTCFGTSFLRFFSHSSWVGCHAGHPKNAPKPGRMPQLSFTRNCVRLETSTWRTVYTRSLSATSTPRLKARRFLSKRFFKSVSCSVIAL